MLSYLLLLLCCLIPCYVIHVLIVDKAWQLVFGGLSDFSGSVLNSVELYNWRTGQQCQLPNLTYPIAGQVSIVMNGTPAYCGGTTDANSLQCFNLDKVTRTWIKVSC